jgi:N-acetylmuramoyl-L-alanine amidase
VADTDAFSDQEIFAKTIFGEARNQGDLGMVAVASVIMNRSEKPSWWGGPDVRSICLKPWQFSCWNKNDPNRHLLLNTPANDKDFAYCMELAARAMAEELPDCTNEATSYYARSMKAPPHWAFGLTPCAEIGDHIFFKI